MMKTAGMIASKRVTIRRSHGANPPVHEAFHDHLPGQRAGDRAALPAGQQGDGKKPLAPTVPNNGASVR